MESVLQRCIAQDDVNIFDMTIGDEDYKRAWSDLSLSLYEYLEARSLKGLGFVTYRRLRSAARSNRRLRMLARTLRSRLRARAPAGALGTEAGA
ncbi:MAG: hypothetical protein GEU95_06595 [Rhizobiales bacterium]|nr:hypothetical protein [Hyphomicrobiales bacterium]